MFPNSKPFPLNFFLDGLSISLKETPTALTCNMFYFPILFVDALKFSHYFYGADSQNTIHSFNHAWIMYLLLSPAFKGKH